MQAITEALSTTCSYHGEIRSRYLDRGWRAPWLAERRGLFAPATDRNDDRVQIDSQRGRTVLVGRCRPTSRGTSRLQSSSDLNPRRERSTPDYVTRLFKGGQRMHRADKITLQVETVIVHHDDGTQHPVPRVVTPGEPILIRNEWLAAVVRTKATKPYQSGLQHVSLIIRDDA